MVFPPQTPAKSRIPPIERSMPAVTMINVSPIASRTTSDVFSAISLKLLPEKKQEEPRAGQIGQCPLPAGLFLALHTVGDGVHDLRLVHERHSYLNSEAADTGSLRRC